MALEYVEQRNGGYYVRGTRVSLDSVVHEFRNGASPETIAQSFPALTLEQVYGAIAFYLGNRPEVDAYLKEQGDKYEELRRAQPPLSPDLQERLRRAREDITADRG